MPPLGPSVVASYNRQTHEYAAIVTQGVLRSSIDKEGKGVSVHLLKIKDVLERTSLSRSMMYNLMSEDRFPKPHKVGDRAARWFSDEIDAWIEQCRAERDDALDHK